MLNRYRRCYVTSFGYTQVVVEFGFVVAAFSERRRRSEIDATITSCAPLAIPAGDEYL
jgi:hypothetical protein